MTTTSPRIKANTPLWAKIVLFIVLIAVVGAGGAFTGLLYGKFAGAAEIREVQVVRSVELQEQVVLVQSAILGLKPKKDVQDIGGVVIPWSDRSILLQYEFDTKVGINGEGVTIERTGDRTFLVTIPDFIVIGTADPRFSIVDEKNGVFSFVTPEIDTLELSQELLTDDVVSDHIEGLRPLLEEQAKGFYTNIITAIDPEVTLKFEFAQ